MTLDAKLRWKAYVKKKREEFRLKYKKMYWLMGRRSALSIHNKLNLYKQTCVDLWHTTMGMHEIEQHWHHSTISKQGTYEHRWAPWYIRNADLHRDLQMEMVTNVTGKFAKKHKERILHHVNVEAIQLLDNSELVRRLKQIILSWCSEH